MWSDIHISGQPVDMLSMQIKRCKGGPLFVFIKKPGGPLRNSRQDNMRGAASLIQKNSNQVVRLAVYWDCLSFRELLGLEWPNLENLDFTDTCYLNSIPHRGRCNGGLPKLRDLSIRGGFIWPMTVAKDLKTFQLQGSIDLELSVVTELLRRNTLLESLELTNLVVRELPSHYKEESIELPHLKNLSISNSTYGSVMTLLKLPSLKRLVVSSKSPRVNFWFEPLWSKFCRKLSITRLEAQHRPSSRGSITVVGSNGYGPDSESFYLKDFSNMEIHIALLRSLSSLFLSSVTMFSFINNMPEGALPLGYMYTTCELLKHLSRVECMCLCPSQLAVGVVRRLRDDSKLCPRLRRLWVKAPLAALDLVDEMLKIRASGGDEWEMRIIESQYPSDFPHGTEPVTRAVWKKTNSKYV